MWQSKTVQQLKNRKKLAFTEGSNPANEAKLRGQNTATKYAIEQKGSRRHAERA